MKKHLVSIFTIMFTVPAMANMTVTGTIQDDLGPIIGAAVMVAGNNSIGTTTDNNGQFTLSVPDSTTQIQTSMLGYHDKIIDIPSGGNVGTIDLVVADEQITEATHTETITGTPCSDKELAAANAKSGTRALRDDNSIYCIPIACARGYKLNKRNKSCEALNCESPRYVLSADGTDCEDQVGKSCDSGDANATKSKYVWENKTLKCEIKKCRDGFVPNDTKTACEASEGPCPENQLPENATAGELKRGKCHATECAAGYDVDGGKCVTISGDCDPMPENARRAHREWNAETNTETCVIDECKSDYTLTNNQCLKPQLSKEDAQKQIDELRENADAMREREQSLANKTIGAAAIGATGIGGMQLASALAEQRADDAAERDMTAYLVTFRCDYGAGRNISGGEVNIQLPGANTLLPLYNEYTTLAADLKTRKTALGMTPGLESEVILDAATSGLYDNESLGKTDGAYTSLARALSDPNSADAAEWATQRADTQQQLKTGAITAGAGALVGIVGNVLTNYVGDQPREQSAEIRAKYESLKTLETQVKQLPESRAPSSCPSGATGTYPDCTCTNSKQIYNANENQCDTCPGDLVASNGACVCPDGMEPGENDKCVKNAVPAKCDTTGGHVTVNATTGDCTCTDGYVMTANKCDCPTATHEIADDGTCKTKTVTPVATEETAPIVLPANNLFDLNSYTLTSAATNAIKTFVSDFKTKFGTSTEYCIKITGHTDKSGTDAINNPLSQKRADAVKNALISSGLNSTNITATGRGSADCQTTNARGIDENCRKVEITATNANCPA